VRSTLWPSPRTWIARNSSLTFIVGALAAFDVTDATFYPLSSATLVVLLKKTEAEMAALSATHEAAYMQPYRPMGMGGAITKLAASCVLGLVDTAAGIATEPHQFAINAKVV